jgi:cytochrome d ubiquinol oxidase subunit II
VAVGNVLRGIPIDETGNFAGTFLGLLNPYSLLFGLLALAMVATHGALYVVLKTEGDLAERARGWAVKSSAVYAALFLAAAAWTVTGQPHLMENYGTQPVLWALPALALAGIVAIPVLTRKGAHGKAFIASSLAIAGLFGTAGAGLFPRWVPALGSPERSLTIFNSSSSELTLKTMLVLALIGMPLVIGYTIYIYRTFGGKVEVDDHGY